MQADLFFCKVASMRHNLYTRHHNSKTGLSIGQVESVSDSHRARSLAPAALASFLFFCEICAKRIFLKRIKIFGAAKPHESLSEKRECLENQTHSEHTLIVLVRRGRIDTAEAQDKQVENANIFFKQLAQTARLVQPALADRNCWSGSATA